MRRTIPVIAVAFLAGLVALLTPRSEPRAAGSRAGDEDAWPIVTVTQEGGFVTPEALFSRVPDAVLAADGRLITPGPQILIYPGPALPNLRSRQLDDDGLATVHELARAAGFDAAAPDYGQPPIADATTTVVTYTDDEGRSIVHGAYALGLDVGPLSEGSGAGSGLDPDQQAARQRLSSFVAAVSDPTGSLPAASVGPDSAYTALAFRIRAQPAISAAAPPWPLAHVKLADAGTCLPVTGPDAVVLSDAFAAAGVDAATPWNQAGLTYTVSVRPLLPGDSRC